MSTARQVGIVAFCAVFLVGGTAGRGGFGFGLGRQKRAYGQQH